MRHDDNRPTRRMMTCLILNRAMLFLFFDIEFIFNYPWDVIYLRVGVFGFIELLVFVFILFIGYIYIWKKGALEWE